MDPDGSSNLHLKPLEVAGFGNRSVDDRQKVFVWILLCWCSLGCNINCRQKFPDSGAHYLVDSCPKKDLEGYISQNGRTGPGGFCSFWSPKVISVFPGELLVMLIESLGWKICGEMVLLFQCQEKNQKCQKTIPRIPEDSVFFVRSDESGVFVLSSGPWGFMNFNNIHLKYIYI